ncbi:MAG: hypothetical protein U0797_06675 [Gemmataceae bacterium]
MFALLAEEAGQSLGVELAAAGELLGDSAQDDRGEPAEQLAHAVLAEAAELRQRADDGVERARAEQRAENVTALAGLVGALPALRESAEPGRTSSRR